MKQRFDKGASPPEFFHFGAAQARAPYRKQSWRLPRLIDLDNLNAGGTMSANTKPAVILDGDNESVTIYGGEYQSSVS